MTSMTSTTTDPVAVEPVRPRRSLLAAIRAVATLGVALLAWQFDVAPAHAAETVETINGRVISLVSIQDRDAMANVAPGSPVSWQVGVLNTAPSPGRLTVSLAATGSMAQSPSRMQLSVASCTQRWSGSTCPGVEATLDPVQGADAFAGDRTVTSFTSDQTRWLMVTVSLTPGSPVQGSTQLRLTAAGQGDQVSAGTAPASLPKTGFEALTPMLQVALASLATGVILMVLARAARRRRSDATSPDDQAPPDPTPIEASS